MTINDFNAEASNPRFTYRKSPVQDRAFMIMKLTDAEPVAVGDYTVLDKSEDIELTEKKVMNLVSLLNGRKKLMQLGHETRSRILYNVVSECDDDGKMRVIFYQLGQEGVSVENALFRLETTEYVH